VVRPDLAKLRLERLGLAHFWKSHQKTTNSKNHKNRPILSVDILLTGLITSRQ
jgi:hypothetical protein